MISLAMANMPMQRHKPSNSIERFTVKGSSFIISRWRILLPNTKVTKLFGWFISSLVHYSLIIVIC
ncbi:hypothetical protein [Pedobacter helvus]|uniref:Uncharacterized protein n=1 Tax=Pedobacter helvus TaxID=2563444 RepID=A0ABW9JLK9_9SPHI